MLLAYILTSSYFSIPPGLLSAVCYTESRHDGNKINYSDNGSPSYGVCQIKMGTAISLGFTGTERELIDSTVNVYYSGAYLAKQLSRYDNNIIKALAAYNSGTCRLNSKGNPLNEKYVKKVLRAWMERK